MNEVYTVEATKVYDEQVLREVIKLDKMVYPENLQGVFDAEKERFMKVPESFLLLKQGDTIVGYFCFFPITRTIRRRMMNEDRLFDNDITAADMKPFKKWDSHTLFIISIVVHTEHRGRPARMLLDAFYDHVVNLNDRGYNIDELLAYAVSGKGESTLLKYGFKEKKQVELGYKLFYATYDTFEKSRAHA